MSDSQLNLESKTEASVAKAQNYIGGRGTPHRKNVNREGGHRTKKFGNVFIQGWGHRT